MGVNMEEQQQSDIHHHSAPIVDGIIVSPADLPWYKKITLISPISAGVGVVSMAVLFIGFNILLSKQVSTSQTLRSHAAVSTATIAIKPSIKILPPNQTFQLWINVADPVGFAVVELTFDQTKINVASEVTLQSVLTNAPMGESAPKLNMTTMAQANQTGKIKLTLALPPGATAPTGAIQIASLVFTSKTTDTTTTTLQIPLATAKVSDINANEFAIVTQEATVSLNPKVATDSAISE